VDAGSRRQAREAACGLLQRGADAAAVEAGQDGKLVVWRNGELFLTRHEVATVDTTGDGDAFAAALAVRLAEGASSRRRPPSPMPALPCPQQRWVRSPRSPIDRRSKTCWPSEADPEKLPSCCLSEPVDGRVEQLDAQEPANLGPWSQ
jgi:hypothetical protein